MQQEALGPNLTHLLYAADTPGAGANLPAPDDRFNISTAGRGRAQAIPRDTGPSEYEVRRFPPSYTPKGQSSPFLTREDPTGPIPGRAPSPDRYRPPPLHDGYGQPQPFPGNPASYGQPQPSQGYPPNYVGQPQPSQGYPASYVGQPQPSQGYPASYVGQPQLPQGYPSRYGQPQPSSYQQSPYGYPHAQQPPPNQYVHQPMPPQQQYANQPQAPAMPGPQGQYVLNVPPADVRQVPSRAPPGAAYLQTQAGAPVAQGTALPKNVYVVEQIRPLSEDLVRDPHYHNVRAQMDEQVGNDSCTTSFTSSCINLGKTSYRAAELCLSPLMSRRKGTPSDSRYMRLAFVTGWTMLTGFVLPLVPSHPLRTLWALALALVAITTYGLGMSITSYIVSNSSLLDFGNSLVIRNILGIFAMLFAIIDLICCLVLLAKRCLCNRNLNPEVEPLIQRQYRNKSISGWFSKYNDILRLIISEMFLYAALILSLPRTAEDLHNRPSTSTNNTNGSSPDLSDSELEHVTHLKFATFMFVVVAFVVFVYIVQFLALIRAFNIRSQLSPHSPVRRKAFYLLAQLIWLYIGQRAIQVVMLITFVHVQVSSHSEEIHSDHLALLFLAYLTPTVTLLTSLVLYWGWIEDVCITQCMDYLQKLENLAADPQTSQATNDEIRRILNFYDYRNISVEVGQFSKRNTSRNCLYPLQSPVAMLLCLPSLVCLVAYFCQLSTDVHNAPEWVSPQVVGFVIIDAQLVFVLTCLLIILPVSVFVLLYRVVRRRHR